MKREKISIRKKDILAKLCNAHDYITIADIAQDIGVSSRTILRELKEIEDWLVKRGIRLIKKTGVGISLHCAKEKKEQLLEWINNTSAVKIFTPSERQTIITSELLQKNEPIKLYYLSLILDVTEGTISKDLNKVEEWLERYHLKLVRKPGLGVFIQGEERNKRRAIVNLIYKNVEEKQLLDFVRKNITNPSEGSKNIEIRTRNRLLNLIDKDIIIKLEELIYQAEEDMGYQLAESAYAGLIVHLALAIKRIENGEKIVMDQNFLQELRKNPEFLIAKKISNNISHLFHIKIHDDEVGYITMHLMGSKNKNIVYNNADKNIANYELVKLAREMIKVAESETGYFLRNNEKLLMGLVNHLGPTLKRLKMKMDIRNPLLEEIKTRYPHLISISQKAAKTLEDYLGETLPQSEIGYLAMHLGAAIENREVFPQSLFRVAVACPSGIGTSRLLAARIEKEYKMIEVVDVISTFHIEEKWLEKEEIDFIISTISIEKNDIPVIIVNPFLLKEDKEKIDQFISNFSEKIMASKEKRKTKEISFRDQLLQMQSYNQGIIQILDNFFLKTLNAYGMEDLIGIISREILEEKSAQEQLRQDLCNREEKGGTFISDKNFHLLHCRSASIEELYFGAIHLTHHNEEKTGMHLVILMLAPKDSTPIQLEVMGEVSKLIINRPHFLSLLKNGLREEAYVEISNGLKAFYQERINKR
ncbi:BglG family transcription antiterminator [Irregularibacter muris]|uniref:BglG family transcription antiterminator n=1 Tax=Irregularibacter muris TaxID=1796619 RepID=A0AAE3HF04_9FIRM|nr:BglG family transcription antiterminator [Irregularibacter muris]MCR1898295.1 BglG family transcription antiterminator [Irregularibacter muris]